MFHIFRWIHSSSRLEIYFRDSRSLLVVFLDKKRRSDFEQHFPSIMSRLASELVMSPGAGSPLQRTPLRRMGSRMLSGFRVDELSTATRKWQARELSNVCLMIFRLWSLLTLFSLLIWAYWIKYRGEPLVMLLNILSSVCIQPKMTPRFLVANSNSLQLGF